ncbi:MAG: hypothetical protein IKB28_08555 [Clostridia bacterium]|nr:hypothetical protein [Clostridia bacterium]
MQTRIKLFVVVVLCVLLCANMALPVCAFGASDPNNSPIENFFDNVIMMLFVILAGISQGNPVIFVIGLVLSVLIGIGICVAALVIVIVVAIVIIRKIKKKRNLSNTVTAPDTEDTTE